MHVTFDLSNSGLETKYSNMLPTLVYLSIIMLKYTKVGNMLLFCFKSTVTKVKGHVHN